MKRRITAMEARQRFGEVLDGVRYRGDEVIIERAGRTMAVVISPERYEAMQRARERLFRTVDELADRARDVPDEDLGHTIDEAVREARAGRRGRKR